MYRLPARSRKKSLFRRAPSRVELRNFLGHPRRDAIDGGAQFGAADQHAPGKPVEFAREHDELRPILLGAEQPLEVADPAVQFGLRQAGTLQFATQE